MSTILNALYKETQNPAYSTAGSQSKSNRQWKVALFSALLIIIALLSCLLFLLLNPSQPVVQQRTQAEKVALPKLDNKPLSITHTAQQGAVAAKPVTRVLFVTTPIISSAGSEADIDIADKDSAVIEPVALPAETQPAKESTVVSANKKEHGEAQPEIDYSHVPTELQQRFEQALAMNAQPGRAFIAGENSDGSDIYQMSSDFQERVPAISYDFHVYSSLAAERWIRINGEDLKEGQFDRAGNLQVLEIAPQRTVFRLGRQSFSLQSLTDWQGAR